MKRYNIILSLFLASLQGCSSEEADLRSRTEQSSISPSNQSDSGVAESSGETSVSQSESSTSTERSDPQSYPLHGLALFHHVNVYSEPNSRSERRGVLRRGSRVKVGKALEGRGCREGRWHPVKPSGYVCSGRTMDVGEEPPEIGFTPTPPRMDAPTPYDYGRNYRDGIPLYRRPPRPSEIRAEAAYQAKLVAEREAAAQAAAQAAAARAAAQAAAANAADGGIAQTPESPVDQPDQPQPAPVKQDSVEEQPAEQETEEEAEEDDEEEEDDESMTGPIVTRLKRGFFVTIERIILKHGKRWVRTSELNYVDADAIRKREVADISGFELGSKLSLPLVIVRRDSTLRQIDKRGRISRGRQVESYTGFPLLGEIRHGGKTYYTIGNNELIASDRVRRADPIDPPPEIGPDEKWIDVRLSSQTLVAYEGARPVFATVVSTGKQGFETPTGSFRITSKFISTNMSDVPDGDEPYLIEDVPWTMYFNLAIAVHGAFWHGMFGRERSHGCVNLAPADARWIFFWVGPELPEGWHGIVSTEENPGTRVYVRR